MTRPKHLVPQKRSAGELFSMWLSTIRTTNDPFGQPTILTVQYAYLVVCLRTKFFRAENNSHQTLCDHSLLRDSANEDVSEQSLVLLKSTSCWSKTR